MPDAGGDFEGLIDVSVRTLLQQSCAIRQAVAHQDDAQIISSSAEAGLFQLIHLTTTISAMPTCRTSSTSGCGARSVRSIRTCFATIAVPKAEELVATPYRHGTKQKAEKFFLDGMTQAMHNLAVQAHPAAPITIYYAFKQSETESEEGTSSHWLGNLS